MRLYALIILTACLSVPAFAQERKEDSDSARALRKQLYSSARKAAIMSAILPGLGQGYNKKYWKIPIIYAGLGGFGYMFYVNNIDYNYYVKDLTAIHDGDSTTMQVSPYTSDQLIDLKKASKRNRDIAVLGTAIVYLVNIVDANVDAHLKTFDVSDDLGIQVKPVLLPLPGGLPTIGLGIKLKLK